MTKKPGHMWVRAELSGLQTLTSAKMSQGDSALVPCQPDPHPTAGQTGVQLAVLTWAFSGALKGQKTAF